MNPGFAAYLAKKKASVKSLPQAAFMSAVKGAPKAKRHSKVSNVHKMGK